MLELSAVIFVHLGHPDHLILIRLWNYLKDVGFSTPIAHLAELKARIAQHILNVTPAPRHCYQLWNTLFLDFNFLLKTLNSILNMFCNSLAKFKNQFDGCFLCYFLATEQLKTDIMVMILFMWFMASEQLNDQDDFFFHLL